jgi:16S rRNA (uracil1498-N3)-methyltransferase
MLLAEGNNLEAISWFMYGCLLLAEAPIFVIDLYHRFACRGEAVMHRFFVEQENFSPGQEILLTGEDAHHIFNVLRLVKGEEISIGSGKGEVYRARLETVREGWVKAVLLEQELDLREPSLSLTLAQGIPKGEKMDNIIRHAVELGVSAIIPMRTERTVPRFSAQKGLKKCHRWQKIARSAAALAKRSVIPKVLEVSSIGEVLETAHTYDAVFLPWEEEKENMFRNLIEDKEMARILLLIGPEGGFSEHEVENARKAGAKIVSLGPRIMSSETAALAAVTILQHVYGDLG